MIALRGAVQVEEDSQACIASAVEELCAELARVNALHPSEIVSAIFTLTPDLHAAFPASAARSQGWGEVPMICAQELRVEGALPRCCRVLVHVQRSTPGRHVYLRGAQALRPDLIDAPEPTR
jgi:chorismate mutase